MSVSSQISLVERLGDLYHDQLRKLCQQLGLRAEGVTNLLIHGGVGWYCVRVDNKGAVRFQFHFAGQTCEVDDAYFGKGYTTFVTENTLHVLYTILRQQ